jgi:hypothetical protein
VNIGVDFHDTLTAHPEFFNGILTRWPGVRYIVSGTPASERSRIKEALAHIGFYPGTQYDDMLLGYEYDKGEMDAKHFQRMKLHKAKLLRNARINVYFDDNPVYAEFIRNEGIAVFQAIHSDDYLRRFAQSDPYFTANLQAGQFDYLADVMSSRLARSSPLASGR